MKKFFEKYTPKSLDKIVSNKKAIIEIKNWAQNYKNKPLFIYGASGVGKTLCANLIAKEMGWSILNTDSSEIRDKDVVKNLIQIACTSNTLFLKTRLILIDEIDSIIDKRGSGNDTGFFSEFSKILTKSIQPIIFIANNPYENKKARPIFEKCKQVKFDLPNKISITKFAKEICDQENIEYDEISIKALVENCGNDIRAMINDLFTLSFFKKITLEDIESLGSRKKEEDVFKVMQKIFFPKNFNETRNVLKDSNISWDLLIAWVEENLPRQYTNARNLKQGMEKLSNADLYYGRIRGNKWILLKYVIDYLTIGVAYSKTEKQNFKYIPFQFPKAIRELGSSKNTRTMQKSILNKLQEHMHCSKKIILRDHLKILKIIAKTNKFTKELILRFNFDINELKYLGCKITPKKYEELIK
jgi:replication factor C large subunit